MLRLYAITRGPMVSFGHVDGQVHSVFDRVCNLKQFDGSLLTLSREDVFNGPGIIRCQTDARFSFMKFINIGEPWACRSGILRVGKHIQVDLRTSIPWQVCIKIAKHTPIGDLKHEYLNVFDNDLLFDRIIEIVSTPERYLLSGTNLHIALEPLIGKGPGLTPLGDDFIVGVAAGMEAHTNSCNLISNWLKSIVEKTTALSGRALYYASHGWFIEPIVEFVNNLSDMPQIKKPIPLFTIGDTSGMAMAYGCLVGFQRGKILDQKTGSKRQNCCSMRPRIPNLFPEKKVA